MRWLLVISAMLAIESAHGAEDLSPTLSQIERFQTEMTENPHAYRQPRNRSNIIGLSDDEATVVLSMAIRFNQLTLSPDQRAAIDDFFIPAARKAVAIQSGLYEELCQSLSNKTIHEIDRDQLVVDINALASKTRAAQAIAFRGLETRMTAQGFAALTESVNELLDRPSRYDHDIAAMMKAFPRLTTFMIRQNCENRGL